MQFQYELNRGVWQRNGEIPKSVTANINRGHTYSTDLPAQHSSSKQVLENWKEFQSELHESHELWENNAVCSSQGSV